MNVALVLHHVARRPSYFAAATGALERRNPVPTGRYWQDIFAKDASAFESWTTANKGKVRVIATEHYENDDPALVRDWILFEVLSPVEWRGPGYPTIAAAEVTSSADTVERPDPPPAVVDQLQSMAQQTGAQIVGTVGKILLAGLVIEFFLARRRDGK